MARDKITKKKTKKSAKQKTDIVQNAGKVLTNLGQVIFATFFLDGVLRGTIPQLLMIVTGILGSAAFIVLGLFLSAKKKDSDSDEED